MNYRECDKIVGDMCTEVDAVYRLAIMLVDRLAVCDTPPPSDVPESMVRITESYRSCKKVHVRDAAIVKDRLLLEGAIDRLYAAMITTDNHALHTAHNSRGEM